MMLTFSRHPRVLLVTLVVLVHGALLLQWHRAPAHSHTKQPTEMTVSLALREIAAAPTVSPPVAPPVKTPNAATPLQPALSVPAIAPSTAVAPFPVSTASPSTASTTAVTVSAVAAPVLPDREPDYQAAYLNNPKPSYPSLANRMGWQGTVVVNVEVLATGLAGQLSVQRSSGHDVLDDAALQAIRHWRFVPARHNGQLVTQHFLIPIPFVLKESDE